MFYSCIIEPIIEVIVDNPLRRCGHAVIRDACNLEEDIHLEMVFMYGKADYDLLRRELDIE